MDLSNLLQRNVSDLTCDLVGKFRVQADLVFESARSCIEGPINRTINEGRILSQTGSDILYALQNHRKEVLDCKKKSTSFTEGLLCITKVRFNNISKV